MIFLYILFGLFFYFLFMWIFRVVFTVFLLKLVGNLKRKVELEIQEKIKTVKEGLK